MRYTTLRVTEAGVVLHQGHARRLAPEGGAALLAFRDFAAAAAPGVYALRWDGERLEVQARPGSRLFDGMPVRFLPSPLAVAAGAIAKPAPPGPYAVVRADGVATLLGSPDGGEIWESCAAAVVSCDATGRLVLVPDDRPRVASVAEAALAAALPHVRAPILAGGAAPLLLVNAVKGACRVAAPGRAPFPDAIAAAVDAALAATARR